MASEIIAWTDSTNIKEYNGERNIQQEARGEEGVVGKRILGRWVLWVELSYINTEDNRRSLSGP